VVLDVKVEENKETPDLSFPIRFVCGISHAGVNYSTNPAVNLAGVLYFGIFFKKLYLLYIGTEEVIIKDHRIMVTMCCVVGPQK
jgi:hypothetical protein